MVDVMGMLLRTLNRRWLGVTGWVYLLSMILGGSCFFLLGRYHHLHEWTFHGYIHFEGFSLGHERLVVSQRWVNNKVLFHHLFIDTGECVTYAAKDHPDDQLDIYSLQKAPAMFSLALDKNGSSTRKVVLSRTGSRGRIIDLDNNHSLLFDSYTTKGLESLFSGQLTYQGKQAISDDNHWVIFTQVQPEVWQSLIEWLRTTYQWNLDFLPEGWRYQAQILDLKGSMDGKCWLYTSSMPEYALHPMGKGFASLDQYKVRSKKNLTAELPDSILRWYALPIEPGFLSSRQWCIILAIMTLPVGLSLLLRFFRRNKPSQIVAPSNEVPATS